MTSFTTKEFVFDNDPASKPLIDGQMFSNDHDKQTYENISKPLPENHVATF